MKSLKINIFWNIIRAVCGLLFPLITFPYVTRVFGPEKIGVYNYSYSIVSYFVMFASLGFPIYGTRAITQLKKQTMSLSELCSSVFSANLISSGFFTILYYLAIFILPIENKTVYLIVGMLIPVTCISFDWFYQGIEEFKYITIRSLLIQTVFCILLFTFVKSKDDFLLYLILIVLSSIFNYLINLIHTRKYIKLRLCFNGSITHIKGAFVLFLGTASVSLYTYLNDVMAGSLGSMHDVGLYTTGHKIIILCMNVIYAVLASIMPRMSTMVDGGSKIEIEKLQEKTYNFLLYFSLPLFVGIFILSDGIINILAGKDFSQASLVLKILAPTIPIIALSGFYYRQILIPYHKEKTANYCLILGGLFNIILDFYLIPRFGYIGVSIAMLIAESVVTLSMFLATKAIISFNYKTPYTCFASTTIMGVFLFLIKSGENGIISTLIIATFGALIYFVSLFVLKDIFIRNLLSSISKYER